jgi:hypothetical protein
LEGQKTRGNRGVNPQEMDRFLGWKTSDLTKITTEMVGLTNKKWDLSNKASTHQGPRFANQQNTKEHVQQKDARINRQTWSDRTYSTKPENGIHDGCLGPKVKEVSPEGINICLHCTQFRTRVKTVHPEKIAILK